MTRDDIIKLAREAGFGFNGASSPAIERFAALVAAAEREACAKIVEQYCGAWDDAGYALSQAVRARGQE